MLKKIYQIDDVLRLIDLEVYKRGWKRTDLVKALNRDDSWLSKIMHKERRLSVQTILDIANILGIDPTSLLPGENPKPKADLTDFFWDSIKERLDKYLEEKFREYSKKNKS